MQACKPALESDHITKVIHDCKRDSEVCVLFYCFLRPVFPPFFVSVGYQQKQKKRLRHLTCHSSVSQFHLDDLKCLQIYPLFLGIVLSVRDQVKQRGGYSGELSYYQTAFLLLFYPILIGLVWLAELTSTTSTSMIAHISYHVDLTWSMVVGME